MTFLVRQPSTRLDETELGHDRFQVARIAAADNRQGTEPERGHPVRDGTQNLIRVSGRGRPG